MCKLSKAKTGRLTPNGFGQAGVALHGDHKIHTGEVPFECDTCKKRFKHSSALKKHERIHAGEVPYECKTCKRRFKQQNALKIHERIHKGEEPQ